MTPIKEKERKINISKELNRATISVMIEEIAQDLKTIEKANNLVLIEQYIHYLQDFIENKLNG